MIIYILATIAMCFPPFLSPPQFSVLYIISFVVITVGFIMFNAVPTYTPITESESRGEDFDNHPGTVSTEQDKDQQMVETTSDHLLQADKGIESIDTQSMLVVL